MAGKFYLFARLPAGQRFMGEQQGFPQKGLLGPDINYNGMPGNLFSGLSGHLEFYLSGMVASETHRCSDLYEESG